jgi:hypothetical protein
MSEPGIECLLCRAERITEWHIDGDEFWVADCLVCRTPMIVWRPHGLPDPETEAGLLDQLRAVARDRFGEEAFWIDPVRRRIPDHWHAHARPAGGFFGPQVSLGRPRTDRRG